MNNGTDRPWSIGVPFMKPTLKTIAIATGFALTTVSRALADDPKIALATRHRVALVAADLGYVPDRAAQRLRTGKTGVISLVLSPHEEIIGFRGSMIAGLTEAIVGTEYHIAMHPYDRNIDPVRPIEHIIRNRLADGLVFSGTEPDDPRAHLLLQQGFPFITHGRTGIAGHGWSDYDNAGFAGMAVDRLAARGRRKLALIAPDPAKTYHQHMVAGFQAAVEARGLTPVLSNDISLASPPDSIANRVRDWVLDGVDGVICPGEVAAMAAMAALTDAGLTDRASVIGKQTSPVFDQFRPRIDTIYEDLRAAGRSLGQLLLRRIAGEDATTLCDLQKPAPLFRL